MRSLSSWIFCPVNCRLIRRDGIRLFNIRYWANVLSPLAGRTTKPAMVKYDPRNLSPGFGGTIPNFDLKLPPISLWEHRRAVRELRAQGRHTINQRMIFDFVLAPARDHQNRPRKYGQQTQRKQAQPHQAQRSGQGGRLQPTAAAEEESSATSVSEADDETALRAPARIRKIHPSRKSIGCRPQRDRRPGTRQCR